MAKKALSIRPRETQTANARPLPGQAGNGQHGGSRSGKKGAIAWLPTLLKGRPRQEGDLIRRPRSRRPAEHWLFIIDASASMRRHGALVHAKGVLLGYLEQAYRARASVAVLGMAGGQSRWLSPARRASQQTPGWLESLGAGGGTPLIESITLAHDWLQQRQRRQGGEPVKVVVLTDGRVRAWTRLPRLDASVLVLDAECSPVRLGRAHELAADLKAAYCHIDDLPVGSLEQPLR
ncbi:VWA domain-containing protein [Pseudomonas duriflava]